MQKIGVFDSGIGGLTVLKDLMRLLPGVDMVYLGDSARLPYGTKSSKTIVRYSLQCARFLVSKGIDMLVVACNTASAHSIAALTNEFHIPVVGVIATGAAAAVATGAATIGVIGTSSTIRSGAYEKTLLDLNPDLTVVSMACPLFVPLVEEGWFDDRITELVAARYLADMRARGIDALLLGCTHYPLLKGLLGRVMGDAVTIVDSAFYTALAVKDLFGETRACHNGGDVVYYLSDLNPRFVELGEIFLGHEMTHVYEVDLGV
ncbi:MAG: glutamate racemase [Syntrophaceae bacterium]